MTSEEYNALINDYNKLVKNVSKIFNEHDLLDEYLEAIEEKQCANEDCEEMTDSLYCRMCINHTNFGFHR